MTPRQRHERIIRNFGHFRYEKRVRYHLDCLLTDCGISVLSDEATRDLAERLVRSHRSQQRMNAENRKRLAGAA